MNNKSLILNTDHLPVDLHFRYRLRLHFLVTLFTYRNDDYNVIEEVFFFNQLIDLLLIVAEVTSTFNETYVLVLILVIYT